MDMGAGPSSMHWTITVLPPLLPQPEGQPGLERAAQHILLASMLPPLLLPDWDFQLRNHLVYPARFGPHRSHCRRFQ